DVPQARDDPWSAGIHEPSDDRDNAFTFDLFAERSPAGAQHDEIGPEFQVVYVMGRKKSILRMALLVDERQHYARQLRVLAVDQGVGGKMHDPVPRKLWTRRSSPVRLEIECCKAAVVWQTKYCFGFLPGERKPLQCPSRLHNGSRDFGLGIGWN